MDKNYITWLKLGLFFLVAFLLILVLSGCGQTPEQTDVEFRQDVELIAAGLGDSNYEVYALDVKGGTCYVATGYQSIAIHCKED